MLYLSDTGNHPTDREYEFTFTRRKGEWIVDCTDKEAMELAGRDGAIPIPDDRFVKWMRDKLNELLP